MAQKKLIRFAQIKTFSNVLEYPENMAGQWRSFFKNDQPVILELACGRGEYTVGLAAMHKENNYIGVDVKGHRICLGAKKALNMQLNNAAFLRTHINRLPEFFSPEEVDEIWITFPDPHLRTSHAKKRLTHPRFLRQYLQLLKPGGSIHLKTDSPQLYQFTKLVVKRYKLNQMEAIDDVYAVPHTAELDIKTHYEALDIAKSRKIHYLHFKLANHIPDLDDELQEELKATENK